MTGNPPLVQSVFRVGKRWRVHLTVPAIAPGEAMALDMEWYPAVPDRRLNKREAADYRRGRDAALAEVAKTIGGGVLVLEA
jgi:hypothetical protein